MSCTSVAFLLSLLSYSPEPPTRVQNQMNLTQCQEGVASVFGFDLKDSSGPARCTGRAVDPESEMGIAHRSLPCGTRVYVVNPRTGRRAYAKVIDRGPYGAAASLRDGATWYVKRRADSGPPPRVCSTLESRGEPCEPLPWRGVADLTPAVARTLRHNGLEPVVVVPLNSQSENLATKDPVIKPFDPVSTTDTAVISTPTGKNGQKDRSEPSTAHVGASEDLGSSGARSAGFALFNMCPPGTQVGPYRVEGLIGSGSMGTVLRATDLCLDRVVALKMVLAADAVHARGLLHGDLKPANVLLGPDGAVKVTDFGLAHLAGTPTITGGNNVACTPAYAAPEVFLNASAKLTPATEVYSIATMAFELLCSELPFTGPLRDLIQHKSSENPPDLLRFNPDLPVSIASAIVAGLARDPRDRPPTVSSFIRLLDTACKVVKRCRPRSFVLVDDDPDMLELLEAVVRHCYPKALLRVFTDSEFARAFLQDGQTDLPLTDLHMPHIGGVALAAEASERGTPTVLITAHSDIGEWPGAIQSGVRYLIPKPATPASIRRVIEIMTSLVPSSPH